MAIFYDATNRIPKIFFVALNFPFCYAIRVFIIGPESHNAFTLAFFIRELSSTVLPRSSKQNKKGSF